MNWIKRYRHQNAKGLKGIKRIFIQDYTNVKWKIQYLWKKYIEYPLREL